MRYGAAIEARLPAPAAGRRAVPRAARSGPGRSPRRPRRRTPGRPRRLPSAPTGTGAAARGVSSGSSRPVSVSSVSSPAASRRCTILASHPLRCANAPRNSLIFGSTDRSSSSSIRLRRGAVASRNRGHEDGHQTAGRYSVLQQAAREAREKLGEYHAVLAAGADPERHPGHQPLAMVHAALHDLGHAAHEGQRHHDGQVGAGDRARDGQDEGQRLGQESEADQGLRRRRCRRVGRRRRSGLPSAR